MAPLYKHTTIVSNTCMTEKKKPAKNNASILLYVSAIHYQNSIQLVFPSPISLNGELERKCSETPPVTASRKDLEVMTTS